MFRWVAPLLVLGCAVWFVYAMGAYNKPKRKKPPVRKSIPVEVVQAKLHHDTLDIVSTGVVVPHREVKISARVEGEVVFKSDMLSPGKFVSKDELLLRIDQADYKLEVARLKQELAKVDVDLKRMKVEEANARRMLTINRNIVKLRKADDKRFSRLRSANAASDTEVDAAQLSMLTAIEKVAAAENQIQGFESQTQSLIATRELATIQLERANLDLARTEIRAPFAGVVIENLVEQNSNIANGAMITMIEDTSKAEVRCNLRSDEIEFIFSSVVPKTNDPATGTADPAIAQSQLAVDAPNKSAYQLPAVPVTIEYQRAGQTFQWDGVLSRQDGLGLDQNTRTMPVRILVDRPTESRLATGSDEATNMESSPRALALVRGMFVQIKFHCRPEMPLMVIPESVLRPGKTVWINRDDKLQVEPIRIARIENGKAYFDPRGCSLTQDDLIISSPVPNAKEGLAVSLKSDKKQSLAKTEKIDDSNAGSNNKTETRLVSEQPPEQIEQARQ